MLKQLFNDNLHIELSEGQVCAFESYADMLLENNAKFNLTAITDREEIYRKHFLDCCFALPLIPYGATLLDMGSGGGFPAVPIAIMRSDLLITALDSTAKKVAFVNDVSSKLNLNVKAICCRAEQYENKAFFDVTTARAVAPTSVLLEYLAPLTKLNGRILLYKGEVEQCDNAVNKLCLQPPVALNYTLSGDAYSRVILRFDKLVATPSIYPRANNKARKSPL